MEPAVAFAFLALIVNRGVDFIRNAFDKSERVPKAWWLLIAWGVGILVALGVCTSDGAAAFFGIMRNGDCINAILAGAGLGSVAGFWHELLAALGSKTQAATPKGLIPRKG